MTPRTTARIEVDQSPGLTLPEGQQMVPLILTDLPALPLHTFRIWVDPADCSIRMLAVEIPPEADRTISWLPTAPVLDSVARLAQDYLGSKVDPELLAEQVAAVASGAALPPRRPHSGSLAFSHYVAGVWRQGVRNHQTTTPGHRVRPAAFVAEIWGVSVTTAEKYVAEARAYGLLSDKITEERDFALGIPGVEDPAPVAVRRREGARQEPELAALSTEPATEPATEPKPPAPPVAEPVEPSLTAPVDRHPQTPAEMHLTDLAEACETMLCLFVREVLPDSDDGETLASLRALDLSPKWLQVTQDAVFATPGLPGDPIPFESLQRREAAGDSLYGRPVTPGDPPPLASLAAAGPPGYADWLADHGLLPPAELTVQ